MAKRKSGGEDADFFQTLKKYKIGVAFAVLIAILLLGFWLRLYHIDYPVAGYHNWKTAHYITEARNFAERGFFEDGLFIPMRDTMEAVTEPPDGAHSDTFPTIAIIVGFLFRFFGASLVLARLVGVIFSVAAVAVFYYLVKELFGSESLALLAAFLAAINPLYVFFSHNVQLDNPALFFMLFGSLYYVKWLNSLETHKYLYIAVLFVMLGAITKYSFSLIGIPILFTLPYKKLLKDKEKFMKPLLVAGIILAAFPAWALYSEVYVRSKILASGVTLNSESNFGGLIDFSMVADPGFWQVMKSYVADNFTLIGIFFAAIGLGLLLMLYFTKNKDDTGYRFMVGYSVGLVAFLFVMGYKLSGHNYHQFPAAPLIIFLIAYFIEVVSKNVLRLVKLENNLKSAAYIGIVLVILFAPLAGGSFMTQSREARDRMFNTQFPGLDIAGEYINTHKNPGDRMFHSSHQSFGVLWHADVPGYKPPASIDAFRKGEELGVEWVFVYQWGMQNYCILDTSGCNELETERGDYIRNNYRLVQIAMFQNGQQLQPVYFLFRKGGTFNESDLNSLIGGKAPLKQQYEMTTGTYELLYINIE